MWAPSWLPQARVLPKIYCANWFRKDSAGKFVWPGYGENMRVLAWIVDRIEGRAQGAINAFGTTPRHGDLDWSGLDFGRAAYDAITDIDVAAWTSELALHDALFQQLARGLPAELPAVRQRLAARLAG